MGYYTILFLTEALIIFRYAIFPTLLSLLLTFLDWNYGLVMSMINLYLFLRIVHQEDERTGLMRFKYIIVKLLCATLVFYLTDYGGTYLEENFLPHGLFAKSLSRPGQTLLNDGLFLSSKKKIKIVKSKAKSALALKASDIWAKWQFFLVRILIEYLFVTCSCSNYRFAFLLTILIVYGVIHVLIWYFVPPAKNPEGDDDDYAIVNEEQARRDIHE